MKYRAIWLAIPALALSVGACRKKEEPKAPETGGTVIESPAEPAKESPAKKPEIPSLTPDKRAETLGFAQYLPAETEAMLAYYNGSKTAERVRSTKLWKLVQAGTGIGPTGEIEIEPDAGEAEEADEDLALPDAEQDGAAKEKIAAETSDAPNAGEMGPAALFGKEFTVAFGKSAGEQGANLLTLSGRMSYHQMRQLAISMVKSAAEGSLEPKPPGSEMFTALLTDPEAGPALLEKMAMPPVYLAFKSEPKDLDAAEQQLAALTENLAMLGEVVEPVEVEKAGKSFTGHRIVGAKVAEMMEQGRENMEEDLEPADIDKLIAAIAKKNLVVLTGTIGEYAVLFLGSSTDDLAFAPSPSQSLGGSTTMAFCDAYASKEMAAVAYGNKDSLERMRKAAGGLSMMAAGIRDGLASSKGIGDTRDLEELLRLVGEREEALLKLTTTDTLGMVAFFEQGLKIEMQGGQDAGAVDWKASNQLASLGKGPNVMLFANMTSDAAYDKKASAYLEALMETAYAAAMKVAELPTEDADIKEFAANAKLFDTRFRPHAVALWDSFSGDFSAGLGQERALIIDLGGAMPAIPGLPQALVDEAKAPRISVVAPVADRKKLGTSWEKMNAAATEIMAEVSKMTETKIPMQKPMSSEKNGFTTWFFPAPFFNDDFLPSVTVGDKWFAASTSKNHALELINQAETASKSQEVNQGLYFQMNFVALRKYGTETVALLKKHSKDVFGGNADAIKSIDEASEFIEAMEDLEQLTVHARREDGLMRTSLHFKTH